MYPVLVYSINELHVLLLPSSCREVSGPSAGTSLRGRSTDGLAGFPRAQIV